MNGKVHVYKGRPTTFNGDGVLFGMYPEQYEYFLQITAGGIAQYDDNISLLLYDTTVLTNYQYHFSTTKPDRSRAEYYIKDGTFSKTYKTNGDYGFIKFARYDSAVAAGTFAFTAYNDHGEKVEITEGFFDISRK